MSLLWGVLGLVGAGALALAWLLFFYDNGWGGFAHRPPSGPPPHPPDIPRFDVEQVMALDGTPLEAWIYRPAGGRLRW